MSENEKVTKLPVKKDEPTLIYPKGDPRNDMTEEEIKEFMKREEQDLNSKLTKFLQEIPETPEGIEDDDDEEEEETFTVDLQNKKVEQKLAEGFIAQNPVPTMNHISNEFLSVTQNPYLDIVGNVFVRKAIVSMIKKYRDLELELEDFAAKIPYESAKAIREEQQRINKKIQELRMALSGSGSLIEAQVDYLKIPSWAKEEIESRIASAIVDLLSLTELGK